MRTKYCITLLAVAILYCGPIVNAQTYGGGDGTATSPYIINTATQLTELSTQVNGGETYSGKYFVIGADINWDATSTFTPIGKSTTINFSGTLDGAGHTINGLLLNGERYVGLFGVIGQGGTVKNLKITNPNFTATNSYGGVIAGMINTGGLIDGVIVTGATYVSTNGSYKGGLVGQSAAGSTVQNSSFSGNAQVSGSFGCIVGQNYGSTKHCWSDATIVSTAVQSTSTHLGGIASVVLTLKGDTANVEDCYFTGNITGASGNNVGGIVGSFRTAHMLRCWNGGYLSASGYTGGLMGTYNNGIVADCYNAGTVYNESSPYVGGIAGFYAATSGTTQWTNILSLGTIFNALLSRTEGCEFVGGNSYSKLLPHMSGCYFDSQVAGWGSTQGALTTRQLTDGIVLEGYSTNVWTFTSHLYPRLIGSNTLDIARLYATPFYLADGETHDKVHSNFTVSTEGGVEWQLTGGGSAARLSGNTVTVTPQSEMVNVVLHSYLGDYEKRALVQIYPVLFSGKGTENDPYLINNRTDLERLAKATNSEGMSFNGEYFKMTADIDLGNDTTFQIVSQSMANAFSGTFNGNGHAIKNWSFNTVMSQKINGGLFAFIGTEGVIENLVIDNSCNLQSYRNFAPIAAINYGTVRNVRNYANVHTQVGFAGGLVYLNYGNIVDCYNQGNVISAQNAGNLGGIAYCNESNATIDGCLNIGEVKAEFDRGTDVGGIVGSNMSTISNVVNAGLVSAAEDVGGIIGSANASSSLNGALSVAPVLFTGNSATSGAVAGKINAGASFSNAYFDTQIAILANTAADGVIGATTEQLVTTTINNNKWSHTNGRYPTLKAFDSYQGAILGTLPVVFASGDTRSTISASATLAQSEGLSWSLTKGKDFAISVNTLFYKNSRDIVSDTLKATLGGITKQIPIGALGQSLPGSGTEQSPYIISKRADLDKIARTIAITGYDYSGKYFSITDDIDMATDTAVYRPIAAGNRIFDGILLGNDHTISHLNINSTSDNVGLIGNLGINGEISNLTIASGEISGGSNTGAFVGNLQGKLQNLMVRPAVTVTGNKAHVGGIVGNATATASMSNLTNYGTVNSKSTHVGGIVGYSTAETTVSCLTNHGDITGSYYVGGISGYTSATNYDSIVNYGSIWGGSSNTGGIGGTLGYTTLTTSIVDAKNYGAVSGTASLGGIVGYSYKNYSADTCLIKDALNVGRITGTRYYVGGIVGQTSGLKLENVANFGDVSCSAATVSSSYGAAAGIVAHGVPCIVNALNTGNIIAAANVGGILGAPSSSYSKYSLTRVLSTGNVTLTGTGTSGGAIQGKASSHLIANDVYYDSQFNNVSLKAVASDDYSGVNAMQTSQIIAGNLSSMNEGWIQQTGRYPMIANLAADTVAQLYSLPVLLDSADTRFAVTKAFAIGTIDGCKWMGDSIFIISQRGKVGMKPNAIGNFNLVATMGNFERVIDLKLNCPDGATIVLDGDVNGDGRINTNDVTVLINMILGSIPSTSEADLNGDGRINSSDITTLITYIISKN